MSPLIVKTFIIHLLYVYVREFMYNKSGRYHYPMSWSTGHTTQMLLAVWQSLVETSAQGLRLLAGQTKIYAHRLV